MRSVFVENLDLSASKIVLKSKDYHHLINVIRLKKNEKVLLFDKCENVLNAQVVLITKKDIELVILEKSKYQKRSQHSFSVALGKLKKDALDLSIKQLVEIGCENIIIYQSSFSQSYPLKWDRVEKLIISAMEQSNNFVFPKVTELNFDKLVEKISKNSDQVVYFSSLETEVSERDQKIDTFPISPLLIIGPEGGLSDLEEKKILDKTSFVLNLPTPILRAQTAVSFCSGFWLGSHLKSLR